MSRYTYYESLKALARQVRAEYGLDTPRVLRSDMRRIYRSQGIRIDLWLSLFTDMTQVVFIYIDHPGSASACHFTSRAPPDTILFVTRQPGSRVA